MSQWVSSTAVHPSTLSMKLADLPQLSTAILSQMSFLQNLCLSRKRISTSPLISLVMCLIMRHTIETKDRSLYGSDVHDPCKDGAVYQRHDDEDVPVYRSRLRTIDRQVVRIGKETTIEEIAELKRQLENANKQSRDFSAEQATRTAEDDELDRRLHELKRRAKRVQDDIDYVL